MWNRACDSDFIPGRAWEEEDNGAYVTAQTSQSHKRLSKSVETLNNTGLQRLDKPEEITELRELAFSEHVRDLQLNRQEESPNKKPTSNA